ncbi:MAG: DUF4403 family protein [Flavisolibacter sp.]
MKTITLFATFFCSFYCGYSQTASDSVTIPDSQIDLPVVVDLRPIYKLAEKSVAPTFSSPNYPGEWVQSDCATRYKYHFRRSPLQMRMNGNQFDLTFTGFYRVTGSTRACVNGTVLSPWTPACNCGFDEGERQVKIGFSARFNLQRDFKLQTKIARNEPQPLNKCEVCFWGQDVTTSVMQGIRDELDLSAKTMEQEFGSFDLRPYMQQLWRVLSAVHPVPGLGFFSLKPKAIRMENIKAANDFLHINIGLTASPEISFEQMEEKITPVPEISGPADKNGFNIYMQAGLQYDSLSQVLNGAIAGKQFDLSEGIFKKHIIVEKAWVSGSENGELQIEVNFSGSFNGAVFFTGKPTYDATEKIITVTDLQYDLHTKNLLLKTAKWLFNRKIRTEMEKYTRFSLTDYYGTATKAIEAQINKEWTRGVKSFGKVNQLDVLSVEALPDHLLIRTQCAGKLGFLISDLDLSFNH